MKAAVLITVPVWKDWLPVLRFRAGMHQEKVFDMVRQNAVEFLNGYLPETSLPKDMSQYVVAPALGENPGIIGAMCLGMDAYLMECGKNL